LAGIEELQWQWVTYTDAWGDDAQKLEYRKKFPSGMTGLLAFEFLGYLSDGTEEFNVNLDIRRKRKRQSIHREVTGRDGLETASWALAVMSDFEEIRWSVPGKIRINVGADDDRRWRVYERILTKRGYTVTMVDNCKTLVKTITMKTEGMI